ncbi:MAG: cupin domain-containing protein [Alphaproteobacteria bacterium]|uniref:cupin domain-containing protein n=1 Tax=Maricaulis alexandrii TaxID=2570354 RepID=UPI001108A855|nr:cupin domain-containing protein [Maricaulis alexandrii]MCR9266407.1 cupin domain-containing protein [Alphaproteobacteria bacterium]
MTRPPVTHIDDLPMVEMSHGETFAAKIARLGPVTGMRDLGCMLTVVPPGKKAFPRHNHHNIEEAFVILEGEGEYRFGDTIHPVRAGHVLSAPIGGPETAHQLVNTGSTDLKYLAFSTMPAVDIVEYPDSGKIGAIRWSDPDADEPNFRYRAYLGEPVDYWEGEV